MHRLGDAAAAVFREIVVLAAAPGTADETTFRLAVLAGIPDPHGGPPAPEPEDPGRDGELRRTR
ncbi:hypothetical protein EDD29_3744 [Actinocorallia herbida]|uniref:Uncharacterized protein n=1 Tax=Actinocorallia herbida TaxID=58109 RepID=A0A3N1CY34_9ACTN|nr:hypothetical protein EDD29_3744 [Actinocorallia herbida]